jgi:enamine deaminase RidA (YjgF/YER057c/UK114 family)
MRLAAIFLIFGVLAFAGRKKAEETQVLELPKDPPAGAVGDSRHLVFRTSPLINKGLLSAQTREAVRGLLSSSKGMEVIKIRAFVAGSGDLRRIPQIVSEMFTDKHQPLPAVTVVLTGGLPLENAQVVLESVAVSRQEVNPSGLAFVPAMIELVAKPLEPLQPLEQNAVAKLKTALGSNSEVLQLTCFATSLEQATQLSPVLSRAFPSASVDLVQTQREPANSAFGCEAVARLKQSIPSVLAVPGGKLVFTGTQLAFGFKEADAELALSRLDRVLGTFGSSMQNAVEVNFFPLTLSMSAEIARVAKRPSPPVAFEGLQGIETSFATEAIAVVNP